MAGSWHKAMSYLGFAEENAEPDFIEEPEMDHMAPVTPINRKRDGAEAYAQAGSVRRIITVHPRNYNDAQVIGEAFRSGIPTIMNLTEMTDADAKRLVDFAAGLVYARYGALERVTNRVFLLSPENIEVGSGHEGGEPRQRPKIFDDGE